MLDVCTNAVLSRGEIWQPGFTSEPYEAGWAKEGLVFLRLMDDVSDEADAFVFLQISPDGIAWVNEGATLMLPNNRNQITFLKIQHFGQFLRLATTADSDFVPRNILATLNLK